VHEGGHMVAALGAQLVVVLKDLLIYFYYVFFEDTDVGGFDLFGVGLGFPWRNYANTFFFFLYFVLFVYI